MHDENCAYRRRDGEDSDADKSTRHNLLLALCRFSEGFIEKESRNPRKTGLFLDPKSFAGPGVDYSSAPYLWVELCMPPLGAETHSNAARKDSGGVLAANLN
jgi:hypothetical protein